MSSTTTRLQPAGICWPPLIWITGLHLGALLAFNPAYFSWSALAVCVFLHWLTGSIGICLAYHRLLTHRSFVVRPKALEYGLTMIGCLASQGGPIGWVADHRKHHAYSDQDDDVHSPNRGFGWAHMFWWMTPDITSIHTPEYLKKWAPDLYRDPVMRVLDKTDWLLMVLFAGALYAIGGMPWLVWGFFVRTVLVLHVTWLVNSASHIWGYRSYKTRDSSRNNWYVGLLAYGEGWHNNHHAFQTSARHGLRWWELDLTYWAIRGLGLVGLAHSIKLPKPGQAARLAADAEGDPEAGSTPASAPREDRRPELAEIVG